MALGTRQLKVAQKSVIHSVPAIQTNGESLLFSERQMDQLKTLVQVIKNDPGATAVPNAGVQHGLTPQNAAQMGLFSAPGVTPQMFSTLVRANGQFEAVLPMQKTIYYQTQREIRTGLNNGTTGAGAASFCDDPPTPGNMKVCQQHYYFGDVLMKTETAMIPRIGEYYNLADQDRTLVPNDDFQSMGDPFAFDGLMNAENPNTQTYRVMMDLYINWQRQIRVATFQGNNAVANNALNYFLNSLSFDGLDRQIRTGYTDAVSGLTCPAVDSDVRTFNANLTTTTSPTIVEALTDMHTYQTVNAENMGYNLGNSAWAFVVHPRMWRPLTRTWPCSYYTTGCNVFNAAASDNGKRINVDAATQRKLQEEMYMGRYLMIDGMSIPVLLSWGVPITTIDFGPPAQYASTIYLVPLRLNGIPTVYFEYFDMGNAQLEEFDKLGGLATQTVAINNGLYRMGFQAQPFCKEYLFAARLRLLLTAPFAASRLDTIFFNDNQMIRDPFVGNTYTYRDGGRTVTPRIYG